MEEKLYSLIDSYEKDMLRDLGDLISIPSVSDDIPEVRRALRNVLDLGSRMGMISQELLDGQVGTIELTDENNLEADHETLGILTHVDVVPPGDPSDWESDPFRMTIKNGRAYGRGTLDDKGMVIASLYAMKAVKDLELPMYKKAQLIIGTQEEVEWTDMHEYVRHYPLADYGFTPDGEYPICNIEKGCMDIEITFDFNDETGLDRAHITSCEIGVAANTIPDKASCLLSDGQMISATGRSVHSCQPEKGDNAIVALSRKLSTLDLYENGLFRLLRAIGRDLSDPFGRDIGLWTESEYYQGEFVHRTAFSPTLLTADEGGARLNINVRFPYGVEPNDIVDAFETWAKPLGGKVAEADPMPAVFVSKEKPYLEILAGSYEKVTGLKNEFTLAYGGSYAKAMPNVVSWGPVFPDEEDTCHEANEYISIDSMIKSTKIFAVSIARILTVKEKFS